jgi:uncharacterized protein (DUF58 family)
MSTSALFQFTAIRPILKELIALRGQAQRLDLAPRGRVLATRSGGHLSRLRGRGMEFDETRLYQPGDDPRHMDWRVTARTGTPHLKLFREERERPVWLLIDQSASLHFGSRVTFKAVIAAQVAALLGWAAVERGDRVGGLIFDELRQFQRHPAARNAGLLPLLERLSAVPNASGSGYSSVMAAATALARHLRPGSLIAVISDFAGIQAEHSAWLGQLAAGREVLLFLIYDQLEAEVPPPGRYPISDGRHQKWLDLTRASQREAYRNIFQQRLTTLQLLAQRHQVHFVQMATDQPVGTTLAQGLGVRLGRRQLGSFELSADG